MKFWKLSIVVASCLWQARSAVADTLTLTNGEKIEGRVVREDADNYVVEVVVSDTIKDEKVFPKSEVRLVEKEPADEKAFARISGLIPTPELLAVENYEARLEKIDEFLKEFPESGKTSKAKQMLEVLNEELEVVRAGGIKMGEEMISAEDYDANAFEYDAIIATKEINDAISRRDFLGALRLFSVYDKTFANAEGREELADRIKQVLAAFSATLEASLESLDSRIEKRQAGLSRMSPENRAQTERALEEEMARISERFEREKSARVDWITPDANHKDSLEESHRQVEKEIRRLESKGGAKSPGISLAGLYRNAWVALGGGTDEEKKAMLDELERQQLPDVYMLKLQERSGLAEE